MALEALNTATVTYQGRASDVAVRKEKPDVKTTSSEAEVERASAEKANHDINLFPPVSKDAEEKSGYQGSGQQNNKQLQQAVEKLKKNMMHRTEAVFGIHEGTNRVMIKIVDKETKDIIKEYPPEKTLDMIQKVWEMAGIMFDEKL